MILPAHLQESVDESKARIQVGYPWWLRPLLMRNVVAITLGRRIYVSPGVAEHQAERLIRHELAHVRQVIRLGLVRFLWRYLAEFVVHLRRTRSAAAAYGSISFELEASAAELEGDAPII